MSDNKYMNAELSIQERAENLLVQMTIKEKVGQLNQKLYGFSIYNREGDMVILTDEFKEEVSKYSGLGVLYGLYRADPWSGKDYENGLTNELAPRTYNQVQRYVLEHSRLKIPMMLSSECPHGHQALDGYLLPVNLCLGATFHPELLEKAYSVCGKQLKSMGVDLALVSILDILRDPRWGRSEECYGEDSYLASEMGKAAVRGIQGEGVNVVAKHFCAQGEGTGGINASAARIGERELREIHYPPMAACCKENVKGVMAAYNEIDGVFCHINHNLLTEVLRDEMKFNGIVMADGVAIDQLDVITKNSVLSGAKALKAGIDVGLWDKAFGALDKAVEKGLVSMEDIDRAVLRVLTMKFERGLFEQPYIEENCDYMYSYKDYSETLDLARESVVLLKNEDNILPLEFVHEMGKTSRPIRRIAVIGPNANEIYNQLGDYTPPIREEEGVTVFRGIKEYIKTVGRESEVEVHFCEGSGLLENDSNEIQRAAALAKSSDVTILVLGGSSSRFSQTEFDTNGAAIISQNVKMDCGEGVDASNLTLPEAQRELAKAVFASSEQVITVMIQGRPYAIPGIAEKSNALLCCFYPGIKGGQAIAEILFGACNPSGRLPVSIPRHSGQLPVYYNYKKSYRALHYYDEEHLPLYNFGDGLCYTQFIYSNVRLDRDSINHEELRESVDENESGNVSVHFTVTNAGDRAGYTVPQLYITMQQSSVVTRVRELKAFSKIWLEPGEQQSHSLKITKDKLSIWNEKMEFVVESGEKDIYLHDSGEDLWKGTLTVI